MPRCVFFPHKDGRSISFGVRGKPSRALSCEPRSSKLELTSRYLCNMPQRCQWLSEFDSNIWNST